MKINFIIALLLVIVITSCGGGSSSPTTQNTIVYTQVSGKAFAGSAFSSGIVKVYDFSTGVKKGPLVNGILGTDGSYQLSIPNIPSAILVEANGCYSEKAVKWLVTDNGQPYPVSSSGVSGGVQISNTCPSTTLDAAVSVVTATTSLVVMITPYTHAAIGLADYERRNGSTVAIALNDANTRLSQWVGVDIIKTLPVEPNGNTTFNNQALYGALISSIPSWIYNVATLGTGTFGTGTLTTLAFADAMKMDLAQDGVLNGIGRDNNQSVVNVSIGNTALTTTIYRYQIALYSIFRLRGETEGYSSQTSTTITYASEAQKQAIIGFLPACVAFNGYTGSLVDTSPVVAMNAGQPSIQLNIISGSTLSRATSHSITGNVHDNVGVYANYTGKNNGGYTDGNTSNVQVLIDGIYLKAVSPTAYVGDAVYLLSFWVNVDLYPNGTSITNGPHNFTLQVKDNLGSTSSVSVNINVSN
jgi:hypothetical protein